MFQDARGMRLQAKERKNGILLSLTKTFKR